MPCCMRVCTCMCVGFEILHKLIAKLAERHLGPAAIGVKASGPPSALSARRDIVAYTIPSTFIAFEAACSFTRYLTFMLACHPYEHGTRAEHRSSPPGPIQTTRSPDGTSVVAPTSF